MKFTNSRDGVQRAKILVAHRLGKEEMLEAICCYISRNGPPEKWSKSWAMAAIKKVLFQTGEEGYGLWYEKRDENDVNAIRNEVSKFAKKWGLT